MFVVRYLPHVPINQRKHQPTVGSFNTWLDAENHRLAAPAPELLEVEQR